MEQKLVTCNLSESGPEIRVKQVLFKILLFCSESSNLRPVRSHSDAPKTSLVENSGLKKKLPLICNLVDNYICCIKDGDGAGHHCLEGQNKKNRGF